MGKKIIDYLKGNHRRVFKVCYALLLIACGIKYIVLFRERIIKEPAELDLIIIGGLLILMFLPFVSEITMLGVSLKKEVQAARQESKEKFSDIKNKLTELKITATFFLND